MNEVLEAIQSRRSVRTYQERKLTKAELETIVAAGTWAPSGHNQQPWHFLVVQDSALIAQINESAKAAMTQIDVDWIKKLGEDPEADITHGAPVLIIVSCRADAISGPTDCTAAMQNMMLTAQSMGLGSCWMGLVAFAYQDEALMTKLGVPEGYRAQQAAVFGVPAEDADVPTPPRKPNVASYIGEF